MKKRKYAIVDLETTGGIPKRDKVIEIGIIIHDGKTIIDQFQTLINPERSISSQITRITGITNEMVVDAPKFYEVAKEVVEIMDKCIFVAHNVRFDYQFLRAEYKSLGFTFTKRTLCTVKLSRKAFPSLKSYSLGSLISHFNIRVDHRHRAYDDAFATSILLEKILAKQQDWEEDLVQSGLELTKLPKNLSPDLIDKLPDDCGVYYFLDDQQRIVYIGKSKNIRQRAKQHFSKQTIKTDKLFQQVADISYELTGSELAALLKESKEIKEVLPEINKIQKNSDYKIAVVRQLDKSGYAYYKLANASKAEKPLSFFGSRKSALAHIEQIGESYLLCHKVNKIDKSKNTCFNYEVAKCNGACIGEEPPHEYNQRFEDSLMMMNRLFDENFIVLDEGLEFGQRSIFLVEEGHYRGYGYIDEQSMNYGIEEMKETIKYEKVNPEADIILRNYIWSNPGLEVLYF